MHEAVFLFNSFFLLPNTVKLQVQAPSFYQYRFSWPPASIRYTFVWDPASIKSYQSH